MNDARPAETLRDLVERFTARPGYTCAAGTAVLHVEPGIVHLAVARRPDLLQFSGAFHGGVIAGLADHAAGAAATTMLPAGRFVVTVAMALSFYEPADGDLLIARATTTHTGRRIAHADAVVFSATGSDTETRCAHAAVTFRTIALDID